MQIREVLVEARDRVAAGWTQGAYEREVDGQVCYCARGAILHTARFWDVAHGEPFAEAHAKVVAAEEALVLALPSRFGRGIVRFNDDPDRTQDEVVALFDRAIEAVSA